MKGISDIVVWKKEICKLIEECGFRTNDPSHPLQIYPDLYGNDCLCILAEDNDPGTEKSLEHKRLLTYRLQELLGCKVLVGKLENIMVPTHRQVAQKEAISLFAEESDIVEHYNKLCGKDYRFKAIDLELERQTLGFSDSKAETQSQQKAPMGRFTLYESKLPSTNTPTLSREAACQYLIELFRKDSRAFAIIQDNPDILLDLHKSLKAKEPTSEVVFPE